VKQIITKGIVLSRTAYGEADRIVTMLTPDQGKLRLMARGVRKPKSKLAGGIELFSVSDVTFIEGRGEMGTLISTRLKQHYGQIVKNIERVQLGYDLIKMLNRATEDQPEAEYFELLDQAFRALDDASIDLGLIRPWFEATLLRQAGHSPNLRTDTAGDKLETDVTYNFDFEAMTFTPHDSGHFTAAHIKTLRLLFSGHLPGDLQRVQGLGATLPELAPLVRTILSSHIRV
jgi:DNA repair protein RecO (recombination protein O)